MIFNFDFYFPVNWNTSLLTIMRESVNNIFLSCKSQMCSKYKINAFICK